MADKGFTVAKKVIRLAEAVGWSSTALAEALGVDKSTVSSYRGRTNSNPRPDKVRKMLAALEKDRGVTVELMWFYDGKNSEPELKSLKETLPDKQTSVYNIKDDDSGLSPDLRDTIQALLDQRTIEVSAKMVRGAEIWSAKGAHRVTLLLKPILVGSDSTPLKIEGDSLGPFRRGTVLIFDRDNYPHVECLLLCQRRDNPDEQTIRYIDPDNPRELRSPEPGFPPVSLTEWEILGKAVAEIFGENINVRPTGVHAKRR